MKRYNYKWIACLLVVVLITGIGISIDSTKNGHFLQIGEKTYAVGSWSVLKSGTSPDGYVRMYSNCFEVGYSTVYYAQALDFTHNDYRLTVSSTYSIVEESINSGNRTLGTGTFAITYTSASMGDEFDRFGNYQAVNQLTYTLEIRSKNTDPTISVLSPVSNGTLGESISSMPSISVSDPDNNNLTCKYYIDTETSPRETKIVTNTSTTQTVVFSQINTSNLAEGTHTIKFDVNDGTVSTVQSVNFKYDKSPIIGPITVTSTNKSITISGSATDTGSGLSPTPYGFTLDSNAATWKAPDAAPINTVVSNTAYDVSGNGGRKLVKLGNGWFVAAANCGSAGTIKFFVSKDGGKNWADLCFASGAANNFAIASKGNIVYLLSVSNTGTSIFTTKFDATQMSGNNVSNNAITVDSLNSFGAGCSLEVDNTGNNIYATWCGKNSTNPSSINIRYSKSADGGQTWATPSSLSNSNDGNNWINPCLVLRNGNPVIIYVHQQNTYIVGLYWNGTAWTTCNTSSGGVICNGNGAYSQTSPSAVVSPDGTIHIVWQGKDASQNCYNIRYSKSTDGGITWSSPLKLTSSTTDEVQPSITADKNNNLYILWNGMVNGKLNIKKMVYSSSSWSGAAMLTNSSTADILNPQTCSNTTDFVDQLFVYQDNQVGCIKFIGTPLTDTTYTFNNLTPGKKYTVTFQAKDNTGNISTWTKDVYTKADKPILTQGNKSTTTTELVSTDANAPETQYQISTGTKYVSQTGALSNDPQWISMPDKKIIITGLLANVKYSFTAKARNGEYIETDLSEITEVATMPNPPAIPKGLKASLASDAITLTWEAVTGATGYDIEIDGKVTEDIKVTSFTHCNLSPYSKHTYRVRSRNAGGPCNWSQLISVYTLVSKPQNVQTNPLGTSIILTWDTVPGATGYDLEVDGEIKSIGKVTEFNNSGLEPSSQHTYRVRAKNILGSGEWSTLLTVMTTDGTPATAPSNIVSNATNDTITLHWDKVLDAQGYDVVEVVNGQDGQVFENGQVTAYENKGLNPGTSHTYKVRAKNSLGEGLWSTPITVTTYLLDTPDGLTYVESDNQITFQWSAVQNATSYELSINGESVTGIAATTYTKTGLTQDTKYLVKIKAKDTSGESGWSAETPVFTMPTKPAVPANVNASVSESSITVTWTAVDGAVGYDVELDGIILEDDSTPIYIHNELEPYSLHTYRVRARNSAVEGDWSVVRSIRTLPGIPKAPEGISVKSTQTGATLTWPAQLGATGYDIEVNDGKSTYIIENISRTSYTHRRTTQFDECRYRIRTRNVEGASDWSGYIINNALKAVCTKKNSVDLGLTATDVVDFSKYTLVVTYNPDVIAVTDLCGLSGKPELTTGKVEGTDITITEFSPGRIVFTTDKAVTPGESWTGVINSIKFMAKVTGGTTVTYTVFCKNGE